MHKMNDVHISTRKAACSSCSGCQQPHADLRLGNLSARELISVQNASVEDECLVKDVASIA